MTDRSIEAYDLPQRVASYDANMELMHPNRSTMVRVALDVLPFERMSTVRAVDLGVGTGYFTGQFLRRFPNGRVLAIDGAEAMLDLARARLGPSAAQVEFKVADFRGLDALAEGVRPVDVVFSSFALHHLGRRDKQRVVHQAVGLLRPGGWFVNADLVIEDSPVVEERVQQLRAAGIVERAGGTDPRFTDAASTRRFLTQMEAAEGDQPLTLSDDLAILRGAGLPESAVWWLEYREVVTGGAKADLA